ncbi:avidin-like [Hemiscyllium ocellatum]|uniref:avidin-like n=1 Tax=Hemiscyllium ocellatum TaxID=170820 RepID=UPI00296683BA|nr:avidin-like [Hemiscyllium ocellatum]
MDIKLLQVALAISLSVSSSSCVELITALSGCWANELNSTMQIKVSDSGLITGLYFSKVSASAQPAKGTVTGYQQDLGNPTFGFVVKWITVPGSISVWTGQYFIINEKETLMTMWLLRRSVSTSKDNWDATWTGMDVFHRNNKACKHDDGGTVSPDAGSGTGSNEFKSFCGFPEPGKVSHPP